MRAVAYSTNQLKFPQETRRIGMLEEAFSDGFTLFYKARDPNDTEVW